MQSVSGHLLWVSQLLRLYTLCMWHMWFCDVGVHTSSWLCPAGLQPCPLFGRRHSTGRCRLGFWNLWCRDPALLSQRDKQREHFCPSEHSRCRDRLHRQGSVPEAVRLQWPSNGDTNQSGAGWDVLSVLRCPFFSRAIMSFADGLLWATHGVSLHVDDSMMLLTFFQK